MKTPKHLLILFLISALLIFGTSCTIVRPHYHHPSKTVIIRSNPNGIPPGQMKKATGAKSAKHYAPGQQKKHKRK